MRRVLYVDEINFLVTCAVGITYWVGLEILATFAKKQPLEFCAKMVLTLALGSVRRVHIDLCYVQVSTTTDLVVGRVSREDIENSW